MMQRYRVAFFVTLFSTIVLAGAVGFLWLRLHERDSMAAMAPPASGQPAEKPASSPPASGEPRLVPVTLTPERTQSIGVKTETVEYKQLNDEILTTGTVEADETRLANVEVRFSGWVRKVFVDSTFKQVREGQPLLTIYSPDVVTTENEYLMARQNRDLLATSSVPGVASGSASLLNSSLERLTQWGIPDREILELEETGKVKRELEIDSPVSGYVTERNALPNMYVQPGTKLYSVADLYSVWVYAQVFQNDLGRVKVGDTAGITVDSWPGRTFTGHVSFISPQLDQATRTARVRLEIPNRDGKLSLGMFVNIRLALPMGRQLAIPATAVFQSGTRQIAFVDRGGGSFDPREVETGPRAGDQFVVLKGLKAGERIVTSANFLIDSESQLQAAIGAFTPPPPGVGQVAGTATPQGQAEAPVKGVSQANIDYSSVPPTPYTGKNTFRVKLTDSGGSPVSGAQVTLTFFMPAMPAMGMAAMRDVFTLSDKGGGLYEGPGNIKMFGTWQVTVLATKNGQTIAEKHLSVMAEGGTQ
jgi:Cu(I)/Ag(I) efflux system membrane fusion protein/cobalt-zinc-cadmium efflux system membrane fusion protein